MPIVLPVSTATYSEPTVTFVAMTPEISAFLPGCPSLVIERTIRKIIIDLCQRARVWSMDVQVFGLLPDTYEYALTTKVSYGEVIDLDRVYMVYPDGVKVYLQWRSLGALQAQRPMWPENDVGKPLFYTTPVGGLINLSPIPDATIVADVYPKAFLRPTRDSAEWSQWLYNEYEREIFHGVLHELMAMPERSWSNQKLAEYHGKQWTYLLSQATIRASKEYNPNDLSVQMRPAA